MRRRLFSSIRYAVFTKETLGSSGVSDAQWQNRPAQSFYAQTELMYRPQAETLVKPSLVSPWLFFETNFSIVGPV